ncbi:MAG: dATP/dGTP diphosphohydrolase domain-containing protein [Pontibacterium sp.]
MKPTDMRCFDQVAQVLGHDEAVRQLQLVIDSEGRVYRDKSLGPAFLFGETPQGCQFWQGVQESNAKSRKQEMEAENGLGIKHDAGKPRLGLVLGGFAGALTEVGRVGTFGAEKYTDDGWQTVPDGLARYTDAMMRHLLAELGGETHDPESELLHAAHAAWNALARLESMLKTKPAD